MRRRRLERDRDVRRLRRRRGRASSSASRRRAQHRSVRAARLCCTASRSSILADEDGQVADAHSISAGLDYPGVGPEHAWLRDTGRARYVPGTDEEALEAFARLARTEGIIPALETAHALAKAAELDAELALSASRAAATRTSTRRSRRSGCDEQGARDLPDGRARDAGAGGSSRRRRRRSRRARLSLLRPARRRARDPRGGRAGARRGDAHARVPRLPRRDTSARRRHAARPDDLRVAARDLRLGALRRRRPRRRRHGPDRRRPPGRRPPGGPAHPARRPHLDGRADPPRRARRPTAGSTSSR